MAIYDYNGNVIPTGGSISIANDLNTNDPTKALAASQGVVLKNMIGTEPPIPSGLTQYSYIGAKIDTNKQHTFAVQKCFDGVGVYCQGAACFGDTLFLFKENNQYCYVVNLNTGTVIYTIDIPTADRGFVSDAHCNTCGFGFEYYDENDPFPLVYVSTNTGNGDYMGALVYRIIVTQSEGNTQFTLSLVQTIKFGGGSWSEFVVGDNSDAYIKIGLQVYHVKMPLLSDGSEVFIDIQNPLEIHQFPNQPNPTGQGLLYLNGKLLFGAGGQLGAEILTMDLASNTYDSVIDLYGEGSPNLSAELESLVVWRGVVCLVFRSGSVYKIYFA